MGSFSIIGEWAVQGVTGVALDGDGGAYLSDWRHGIRHISPGKETPEWLRAPLEKQTPFPTNIFLAPISQGPLVIVEYDFILSQILRDGQERPMPGGFWGEYDPSALFDPTGRWCIAATAASEILLWDFAAHIPTGYSTDIDNAGPFCVTPDGREIMMIQQDQGLIALDIESRKPRMLAQDVGVCLDVCDGPSAPCAMAFNPNGDLITLSADGKGRIWNASALLQEGKQEYEVFQLHSPAEKFLGYEGKAQGASLTLRYHQGGIGVINLKTMIATYWHWPHEGAREITLSPDGRLLGVLNCAKDGNGESCLRIYDLEG